MRSLRCFPTRTNGFLYEIEVFKISYLKKKKHLSQCTWRKFSSELLSLTITYEEEQKHTYTPAWNLSGNTKTDWIGFDFISIETNKTC